MSAPIAVLTPMANATVERELRRLLPDKCDYVIGRLVSDETSSEARLRAYGEDLARSLAQFGGMELSGLAFACTASSYLLGQEREAEIAEQLDQPVLWAAAVIRETLQSLGARSLAVISPYPDAIHQAGLVYWQHAGFKVEFESRVDIGSLDTRAIYALDGSEARGAIKQAREARPDVILLSGTGMPTLELIDPSGKPPILSSNLCLASAMEALSAR